MNITTLRHAVGRWRVTHRPAKPLMLTPTDRRRFVLIGTPHHGNLGDHAIAFAEEEFLKTIHPNATLDIITEDEYWQYRRSLKGQLRPEDVILLHGGGNLGNIYPYAEAVRQDALRRFSAQRMVLFPQTVYFSGDAAGHLARQRARAVYRHQHRLAAFAREAFSFAELCELVGEERTFLVPDIVLSFTKLLPTPRQRQGVLLCFRRDLERGITSGTEQWITTTLSEQFSTLRKTDTVLPGLLSAVAAKERLCDLLTRFAGAELVVTDRLHGMIFAALTRTPCIALPNFNHKIFGVSKWLEELPFLRYAEADSPLAPLVKEVCTADRDAPRAFAMLSAAFDPLRAVLEEL